MDTGIQAKLTFSKIKKPLIGNLKGKVLKSNFKLNFIYDENSLNINNFFRDKNLSFDSIGNIVIKPYFRINLILRK